MGGTESCSTGLSSKTPAAGVETITEINCLVPRSVCAAESSSHRPPRGSGGQDGATRQTDRGPNQGPADRRTPVLGQAAQTPGPALRGWGSRMGDKLGQEQSESPPCQLPPEMSTDRPPHGGPRQGCQRQAGRSTCVCKHTHTRGCGVTGGDGNAVRHKHTSQAFGEKSRQQEDGGPLTALRRGTGCGLGTAHWHVSGLHLGQAGPCACPELRSARTLVAHWANTLPFPAGQAPCPTPLAWLAAVLTANSGSPRASHSR